MAKKVLLYSSRKAKAVSVDVPEFDWCPISIARTVTRRDTGGDTMEKPKKGKAFDPKDESTRIFCIIDAKDVPEKNIVHEDLYIKEIGVLNAAEGWLDSITINGDSFSPKDGIEMRSTGSTIEFRVA